MAPVFRTWSSERGFAHVAERPSPQAGSATLFYNNELVEPLHPAPVLLERRDGDPGLNPEAVVNFPKNSDSIKALVVIIVILGLVVTGVFAWKIRAWRKRRKARANAPDEETPSPEFSPLPEKIESEKRRPSIYKRTIIDFSDVAGLQFPTPPKAARLLPVVPAKDLGVGWVPQVRSQPLHPYAAANSSAVNNIPTHEPGGPKVMKARTGTSSSSSRLSRMLSMARKSKSSLASFEIVPPVPPLPTHIRNDTASISQYSISSVSDSASAFEKSSFSSSKKKKFRPLPPVKTSFPRGPLPNLPTVIVSESPNPVYSESTPKPAYGESSPAPPSYRAEPIKSPSRYDSFVSNKGASPLRTLALKGKAAPPDFPVTPSPTGTLHNRNPSSDSAKSKRFPRLVTVVATYDPSRPDELAIKLGDTLRLLEEFQDGWCRVQRLGSRERIRRMSRLNNSKQDDGVIPQFCIQDRPDFVTRISTSPGSIVFPKPFRLATPR